MSQENQQKHYVGAIIGIVIWFVILGGGFLLRKIFLLDWTPTILYAALFGIALGDVLLVVAGICEFDEDKRVALLLTLGIPIQFALKYVMQLSWPVSILLPFIPLALLVYRDKVAAELKKMR